MPKTQFIHFWHVFDIKNCIIFIQSPTYKREFTVYRRWIKLCINLCRHRRKLRRSLIKFLFSTEFVKIRHAICLFFSLFFLKNFRMTKFFRRLRITSVRVNLCRARRKTLTCAIRGLIRILRIFVEYERFMSSSLDKPRRLALQAFGALKWGFRDWVPSTPRQRTCRPFV